VENNEHPGLGDKNVLFALLWLVDRLACTQLQWKVSNPALKLLYKVSYQIVVQLKFHLMQTT
jgi:hypothetical protein